MSKLLCICGPNGAGKSTFSRTVAIRENLLVIDPDKLAAEGLSPLAAGKAADRMARLFIQEGISFARESTLTAHFDLTLMQEAKSHGYEVELVYIRLASPELALARIAARVAVVDMMFPNVMSGVVIPVAGKPAKGNAAC